MSESSFNLLEFIRQQTQAARESTASLAATEQKSAKASEETLKVMATRAEDIGANQRIVTGAAQTGNLIAQQQAADAVTSAGGYEALYANIAQLADRQNSLRKNLAQVRKANEENPGIMPWNAIARVVDGGQARRAAQVDLTEMQSLAAGNKEITSAISTVGNIARANARTITAASAVASADLVAQESAQQADKLRLEGLKYNVATAQAAAQADDKMLELAYKEANFGRSEAQFQLALEEEQRRRSDAAFNRSIREDALKDKQDERATLETALFHINLGRVPRNQAAITMQELRDEIKLNGGKLGKEYAELRENGKIAAATGQGLIATTPAEVSSLLSRDPALYASLDANQKKVADLVMEAQSVLGLPTSKVALADDKTGAKAKKMVTEQTQALVTQQLRYVGNNPDNIFYIGEPASYIGTATQPGVGAFQKYPLVQKVFNPAIAAGTSLSDPSVSYGLTMEAVKRGDISSSQAAADYSGIYRRMAALQRAGADFKKFAIALPPDGAKYFVKVDGQLIDATDFQSVAMAMNRSLASQQLMKERTQGGVIPGIGRAVGTALEKPINVFGTPFRD